MKILILTVGLLMLFNGGFAEFPTIDKGDVKPNEKRLGDSIDKSKTDELTIASFNIRNLGSRGRSLKDFEALADLIDEADVVLFQEVGLGMYSGAGTEPYGKMKKRTDAIVSMFQIFLGSDWNVIPAAHPTGKKTGRETSILAHRKQGPGYNISALWQEFVPISDGKRDMAVFKLTLSKEQQQKDILLGSVHLTPEAPFRGNQLLKVAEWLLEQKDKQAIVMGDFNWGYKKVSKIKNYFGEEKVLQLHKEGKVFQLFHPFSYFGKGKTGSFRTNLGYRGSAFFYDQFLLTPGLAGKLADGGKLLKDCGFIAFGLFNKYMKKTLEKSEKNRGYAFNKYLDYLKKHNVPLDTLDETQKKAIAEAQKKVASIIKEDATWVLSDHRVVWMQLKIF